MSNPTLSTDSTHALPKGWPGIVSGWSGDRETFRVSWGKAVMWTFLLSDIFVFNSPPISCVTMRTSTTAPQPDTAKMFGMKIRGVEVPLLLIAIMTFVLVSSSGTVTIAINFRYRHNVRRAAALMPATALLGVCFVNLRAFEWTKLIVSEDVCPWGNSPGAIQSDVCSFMITGFHDFHVTYGVIYLLLVAHKIRRPDLAEYDNLQIVKVAGLYQHFADFVQVFIFTLFYLQWNSHGLHRSVAYIRSARRSRPAAQHQHLPEGLGSTVRA